MKRTSSDDSSSSDEYLRGAFCIRLYSNTIHYEFVCPFNRQTAEASYPFSGSLLKRSDEIGAKNHSAKICQIRVIRVLFLRYYLNLKFTVIHKKTRAN